MSYTDRELKKIWQEARAKKRERAIELSKAREEQELKEKQFEQRKLLNKTSLYSIQYD